MFRDACGENLLENQASNFETLFSRCRNWADTFHVVLSHTWNPCRKLNRNSRIGKRLRIKGVKQRVEERFIPFVAKLRQGWMILMWLYKWKRRDFIKSRYYIVCKVQSTDKLLSTLIFRTSHKHQNVERCKADHRLPISKRHKYSHMFREKLAKNEKKRVFSLIERRDIVRVDYRKQFRYTAKNETHSIRRFI